VHDAGLRDASRMTEHMSRQALDLVQKARRTAPASQHDLDFFEPTERSTVSRLAMKRQEERV
jgi:hypothetical protein